MMGDVSDQGVPAALFMAKTKSLIKAAAVGTYDSGKILETVNKEICFTKGKKVVYNSTGRFSRQ